MTPKEYLSQIRRFDVLIEQKIKERDELRKYDISGVNYDADRVQVSPSGEAPQVRAVEKIIAYEEEIDRLVEEFYDTKKCIIGQIQGLPKVEYIQLLYKRYVEYKRLEEIAVEMNYNYEYIKHLHGTALFVFGRMYMDVEQNDSTQCHL